MENYKKSQPSIKKNSTKKQSSSSPVMTMIENPLSNFTDEQWKELISNLGNNSKEKIIEIFDSLDDILRKYDPKNLIAILSGYGLTVGEGDDGVPSKESSGELTQAHVELIQALMLQIPENEFGGYPVTPDVVQKVWEQLIEISRAYKFSRLNVEQLESTKTDMATNLVQEWFRSHTQMVRNWGFHSQVVTISKEIFSHFDELIHYRLGFSASNAIDVFKLLIDLVEDRLSERLKILSELWSVKKPYDMLVKYHELIGQGKAEADRYAENFDISKIPHKNLFSMLLSHYDLRMPDIYFVDSGEIALQLNLEKNIIDNVLSHFSYTFGELSNEKKEFFFLDNPVWKKPIISLEEGYYCPMPQLFFSFVLNTLGEIVEEIDKNALHTRQADYLEAKIEEIVKRKFPESQVVSSVKWSLDGIQYETDLIAFIDSHAIIIEAKARKISRPALRGAPDRIKRHLEEILIKPSKQSYRLEQRLQDLRVQDSSNDSLLAKLPVDIHSINKVLRVSVSLEDFATLQVNLKIFDDTGWIPQDFVSCPTMNIADFEILFDFLEHPVQIIHYLQRRTELEGKFTFGCERDYMGLYIDTLLNVGNMVSDNQAIIDISGMSEPLDKFYMSKDQGIAIDKPKPKISPFFKKIFSKLEERAVPQWTEIGCILNYFPPDDQNKLMKLIKDLSKKVNKTWQVEGHQNIAVYVPPESSEYALAVVLFKNENRNKRHEFVENASFLGLEPEHVRYCVVIAINIDNDEIPYQYIAVVEKGDIK